MLRKAVFKLNFQIQLGNNSGAALAQAVFIGFGGVYPATGALLTTSLGKTNGQTGQISAGTHSSALGSSFPITG